MDDERAQQNGEEFREKYLYALAEMENVRKRSRLPVLDNLQRALAYRDSLELRAGLQATLRGFEEALESEGVTPILTTNERFDPKIAEAIATERVADEQSGTVLAEAQRGYLLGEEVLRPAKVIVVANE